MKRFTKSKKVLFGLSLSLVLAMAVGSFALGEAQTPVTPQETAQNEAVSATFGDFEVSGDTSGCSILGSVLTVSGGSPTISMAQGVKSTSQTINVTGSATITLAGVNISTDSDSAMTIDDSANVTVLLADGSTNILTATSDLYAGLFKSGSGNMLTIGVPSGSQGDGILKVTGGSNGAGIGGSSGYGGKNITITGGVVEANGGSSSNGGGAGIGSGNGGSGSNITITGGNVTAKGGDYGAGIGGGNAGSGSDITISGGTVTATGKDGGAGIGGGSRKSGSNITISGGTVTATGSTGGAGIGGGGSGNGIEINITDSEVTAEGGSSGAGIGGGGTGNGSKVIISNSIVIATGGSGFDFDDMGEHYHYTAAAAIGGGGGAFLDGELVITPGTGSENKIDDSSILIAKGGEDGDSYSIETLQGFDEGLKGLVFEQKTDSDVSTGTMYNNVVLESDLTMPENATLTIPQDKTFTINEGKTFTVPDGSVLTNDGTLTIKGTLSCAGTGKVETLLNYDKQLGMTKANDDNHVLYQDATEVKQYENMPSVEKEGYDFDGWYTKEKGQGTKVEEGDNVLLNEHTLYANWVDPAPPTPPTPTPPGPEPTPTPPEPGPEPTPTPDPTPDPSVNPEGDSSSSKTSDPFMGGAALALLGVATTGAVLVRKRK